MLNVIYGEYPEAIYNTAVYFKNVYEEEWITDPLSMEMIMDVDKSVVEDGERINSPVLGQITPVQLSRGVKTLILISKDRKHIFNASACGDNCAKWLLKISEDKKVIINLRHMMDFGKDEFKIKVINKDTIAHNMEELLYLAGEFI